MIPSELHDNYCAGCGVSLDQALRYEREDVIYESGEYAGEPGVEVTAFCGCGTSTRIPFSVGARRQ